MNPEADNQCMSAAPLSAAPILNSSRPHPLLMPVEASHHQPLSAPPSTMYFFGGGQSPMAHQQPSQSVGFAGASPLNPAHGPAHGPAHAAKSSLASLSSASTAATAAGLGLDDGAGAGFGFFAFPGGAALDESRRGSLADSELSLAMGFDDLGFLSPVVARKQSLALSVQSPAQQNYEFDPFAHLNQQHPLLLSSPLSHSLPIHSHSHMQSHLHSQPHLVANQANQPNFSFNPSQRRMSHQIMSRPLDQYDIDFLCRPPMSRHPSLPQVSFLQQQHNPISTPQSPIHHQNNTIINNSFNFNGNSSNNGGARINSSGTSPNSSGAPIIPPNPSQPPHAILKSSPPPKLQIDLTQQPRSTNFMSFFVKAVKPKQGVVANGETAGSPVTTSSTSSLLVNAFSGIGKKRTFSSSTAANANANGNDDDTTPTSATVTLQNTVGNAGAGSSSSISPDPESPPHQHHVKHEDSDWTPTTSGMTPATPTSTSVTTPTTAKRMARYKSASAPNLGTVPGSDNRPRDFICATCHNRFLRRQDLNRHEVTHNRTKQFTCPLGCGTNFGRSDALTRHLKMKKCSGAN